MFRFSFVLILLISTLFSVSSSALEVNDLYQANVNVDSQAGVQREQAIKVALQGVFLKVGGKKSVLTHKVLIQAKKKATSYVSQYRYQRKDDQLSLVVSFNEAKVNQLFKEANLPLWGSLRPQVLLWLIDEEGTTRNIIAADADSDIPSSVNDFSIERGLPIIMPLMDLTDNEQVLLSDFWGYFLEQIQQASSRYFADTVVVMRVSDSSLVSDDKRIDEATLSDDSACGLLCDQQEIEKPKVLDWRVYTQGAIYTQKYQGLDKVSLINEGLSDITALIYQSYALLASAENDFVIEVKNVTSLKSDTQLFNFLADLSAVKNVTLVSAQGDIRRFKLDLLGSTASFLASLKLNDKLTEKIEPQLDTFTSEMSVDEQSGLATDFHSAGIPMKVIVLGEDVANNDNLSSDSLTAENSSPDKLNKDSLINDSKVADGSQTDSSLANEQGQFDNDGIPKLSVKPTIDEAKQMATAESTLLTIKPYVPVFYWEQG